MRSLTPLRREVRQREAQERNFREKRSQGKMPEKETPRRRILWQNLWKRGLNEVFRENIVPVSKFIELLRNSDQITF
jgi:hypothetical protein